MQQNTEDKKPAQQAPIKETEEKTTERPAETQPQTSKNEAEESDYACPSAPLNSVIEEESKDNATP